MDWRAQIHKPTLVVNQERVKQNIRRMQEKAQKSGVQFRPHFKTHQSAKVGEWYREAGVEKITVSSVKMGMYFASNGWKDITIAFPVNLRELSDIDDLAGRVHLNLLLLSEEVAETVNNGLKHQVDVWIKVDVGYGRTGIPWEEDERIYRLAKRIESLSHLNFRGLLTHAGQSYHMEDRDERARLFKSVAEGMGRLRDKLRQKGLEDCLISVGDTPTTTAAEDFSGVDEVRPGNFVYFDAQQYHLGVCREEELGAVVACPVVSVHPKRGEVVLYGGAIHLSKQTEEHPAIPGQKMHGYLVTAEASGWGKIRNENFVRAVSQEHGIAKVGFPLIDQLKPGDLVCVVPVHICLSVDLLDTAITTDSELFALELS